MDSATVHALARIVLQAIALSLLFVFAGKPAVQKILPCHGRWQRPSALVCGGAFFVGLGEFVVLLLLASRIIGSVRIALWLTLGVMTTVATIDLIRDHQFWIRQTILGGPWSGLVALVSITNATLWMGPQAPGSSQTPTVLDHFGSIPSGRYANYAIFIAKHDRVPFLAQNMGQSLLASYHMLLGVNAPLAALTVWIPLSLA